MKSRLFAALLAGTALTPLAAYAQAVTVTHTVGEATSNPSVTSLSPGSAVTVAVGDVVEVRGTYFFNSAAPTITASDSLGNTYTLEAHTSNNTASQANEFVLRAPITVAGSATITVAFSNAVGYPDLDAVRIQAPAGYALGGMDFANASSSVSGDVLTLSGTASQANDVLVGGVYYGASSVTFGTGQTGMDEGDGGVDDSWDSYSQPSGTGTVSQTFTYPSAPGTPYAGAIIAEKVTATVAQCGSSVTPAISSGYYELQCQLNGNLTVNNPTGMGSSKDQMHFQFESDGAGHTVTFGSDYLLPGSTTGVLTEGTAGQLSNTSGDVDDVWGFGAPAFPTGSGERIHLGAPNANMGN